MSFSGVVFDFDGVIIDSEPVANRALAETLTAQGFPTSIADSMRDYMGRNWPDTQAAFTARWGRPMPDGLYQAVHEAMLNGPGIPPIAGVEAFVRSLEGRPVAVASSSSSTWLRRHLDRIGLADLFGEHVYSAAEVVERGKPHPDIYLHAARALGIDPATMLVIEDTPTGVRAAVASGATVVGFCAGGHCGDGHPDMLRDVGAHHVARSYAEVKALLG